MKKKPYETPQLTVIYFGAQDIVTASVLSVTVEEPRDVVVTDTPLAPFSAMKLQE